MGNALPASCPKVALRLTSNSTKSHPTPRETPASPADVGQAPACFPVLSSGFLHRRLIDAGLRKRSKAHGYAGRRHNSQGRLHGLFAPQAHCNLQRDPLEQHNLIRERRDISLKCAAAQRKEIQRYGTILWLCFGHGVLLSKRRRG